MSRPVLTMPASAPGAPIASSTRRSVPSPLIALVTTWATLSTFPSSLSRAITS